MLKGLSTLQVYFSSEDENRQKAGQPPLLVQVQRESILAKPQEVDAKKNNSGKAPKPKAGKKAKKAVKQAIKAAKKAKKAAKPAKKAAKKAKKAGKKKK